VVGNLQNGVIALKKGHRGLDIIGSAAKLVVSFDGHLIFIHIKSVEVNFLLRLFIETAGGGAAGKYPFRDKNHFPSVFADECFVNAEVPVVFDFNILGLHREFTQFLIVVDGFFDLPDNDQ